MSSDDGQGRVGRAAGVIAFSLLVAELLLVILSWLLSATRMEGVCSLLSSEGVRWLFGNFTAMIASPLLVWLLLVLMAWGSVRVVNHQSVNRKYIRDRIAIRVSLAFLVIYVVIIALLTLAPHAILLSATGSLFPSAFSRSLVPVICFGVCLVSVTFGLLSGRLRTLADILDTLSYGIAQGALLIVVYFFAVQLFESLRFVFGF